MEFGGETSSVCEGAEDGGVAGDCSRFDEEVEDLSPSEVVLSSLLLVSFSRIAPSRFSGRK
jgi:hypothetical protein